MILTKDNLLRYVREKKYVTPTHISEEFETSTMIASAALSELAKSKQVYITNIKLGSSPYYYDPLQKTSLTELAQKHLSGTDHEVYNMLNAQQVINDSSLTIQQRLAIERIKDFAIPLEVEYQDKSLKFWVWFLRDIKETKNQILDVLNPKNTTPKAQEPAPQKIRETAQKTIDEPRQQSNEQKQMQTNQVHRYERQNINQNTNQNNYEENNNSNYEEESKSENFIETYFKKNYLKIDSKNKTDNSIKYKTSLHINNLTIRFDCIFFTKKTNDAQILHFYASSPKPKIVFIENAPKKLLKLADKLENFEIINI